MKNIVLILLMASCSVVFSQENLKVDDMSAPNAPGFILLDEAPTSIEKPGSARAFVFSLLNSVAKNNGIPLNYAAEFTPYWWTKHPKETTLKYFGYNSASGKRLPFKPTQTTSFTLSYSQKEKPDSSRTKVNHLAFGIRIPLIRVFAKDYYENSSTGLVAQVKAINLKLTNAGLGPNSIIATKQGLLQFQITNGVKSDGTPLTAGEKATLEAQIQDLEKQAEANRTQAVSSAIKETQDYIKRKPIYSLDLAGAATCAFENENASNGAFGKAGFWATHQIAAPLKSDAAKNQNFYFNLLLTHRLIIDNTIYFEHGKEEAQLQFDNGGKMEFEINRFIFSGEFVYRLNLASKDQSTIRANGILKYKIQDGLYFTGSFGRNFGDTKNLIAVFGINWGISTGNESLQAN